MAKTRITEFPARVQFVGDKNVGNVEKGTAMRFTAENGMRHYEVHLDRGGTGMIHEDDIELAREKKSKDDDKD